jgi:hypothetical protein
VTGDATVVANRLELNLREASLDVRHARVISDDARVVARPNNLPKLVLEVVREALMPDVHILAV